ncbi:RIP metalloprotease RseP [Ligilactobacillus sp. Marseille-Q7487]|jgi:regulator of sigma E protease|uniref:RIP metalloprotease RseP n=1 Tax=Ligilactobacillus sp. Marseille-Q7487 TaxID=3022128 RepID=UPI0015B728DA|nr:RIP metalloprotease RseP [Ligilactobacillus sp. Marseille-Q7487]
MLGTIVAFIIVFGVIVAVHEFGHFYFAKKSGILVREFAIGMGPKIFGVHKNGTTYTIRLLPLGGYVRMAGLEEDDSETLQKGLPVSVVLNDEGEIIKIDTSHKTTLMTGIALEVIDWDLTKELWLEGYENGDETQSVRYPVNHDALIVEKDGTEVRIAPLDVQFQSASLPKRMMTNFAGPLNNFLLSVVVFMLIACMQGGVSQTTNKIASVQKDSVAQKAGLQRNDQIVAINGKKTDTWLKVSNTISQRGGKKTTLTVKRGQTTKKITLTPKIKKVDGQEVGLIGVMAKSEFDRSPLTIITYGFTQTWTVVVMVWQALVNMFTQGFSLNDLGGPVAIYSATQTAAQYGVLSLMSLLGLLSVNLGIVNLLPIPGLDGGKLLLNIIEAIRRKPIDPNKEMLITMIGFGFVLILMILVTWNDIQRYFFH